MIAAHTSSCWSSRSSCLSLRMNATATIHASENGMSTFQPNVMNWS